MTQQCQCQVTYNPIIYFGIKMKSPLKQIFKASLFLN